MHCKEIGTVLKVDIDRDYYSFMKYIKKYWEEAIIFLFGKIGYNLCGYTIKKSSSGNTHVFIYLKEKIDDKTRLFLQFYAGDDIGRFSISFFRLTNFGKPYDKMFIIKLRKNKKKEG